MTHFCLRDCNILPKKELHSSLWVDPHILSSCLWALSKKCPSFWKILRSLSLRPSPRALAGTASSARSHAPRRLQPASSFFWNATCIYYLPIYLSVCLSTYLAMYRSLSLYLSFFLAVCLSIYPSICLTIYQSLYLSITYLSVDLSMYLSIYLAGGLSVCLSIYLANNEFFCLSIYLSIYLSMRLCT